MVSMLPLKKNSAVILLVLLVTSLCPLIPSTAQFDIPIYHQPVILYFDNYPSGYDDYDFNLIYEFQSVPAVLVEPMKEDIEKFKDDSRIKSVESDQQITAAGTSYERNITELHQMLPDFDLTRPFGIFDTGISSYNINPLAYHDFVSDDPEIIGDENNKARTDPNGHGSQIIDLISSNTDGTNQIMDVQIPDANISIELTDDTSIDLPSNTSIQIYNSTHHATLTSTNSSLYSTSNDIYKFSGSTFYKIDRSSTNTSTSNSITIHNPKQISYEPKPVARPITYRVLDADGTGSVFDLLRAFDHFYQYHLDFNPAVLTYAFTFEKSSYTVKKFAELFDSTGIIQVAATGDHNATQPRFPARYEDVLSTGFDHNMANAGADIYLNNISHAISGPGIVVDTDTFRIDSSYAAGYLSSLILYLLERYTRPTILTLLEKLVTPLSYPTNSGDRSIDATQKSYLTRERLQVLDNSGTSKGRDILHQMHGDYNIYIASSHNTSVEIHNLHDNTTLAKQSIHAGFNILQIDRSIGLTIMRFANRPDLQVEYAIVKTPVKTELATTEVQYFADQSVIKFNAPSNFANLTINGTNHGMIRSYYPVDLPAGTFNVSLKDPLGSVNKNYQIIVDKKQPQIHSTDIPSKINSTISPVINVTDNHGIDSIDLYLNSSYYRSINRSGGSRVKINPHYTRPGNYNLTMVFSDKAGNSVNHTQMIYLNQTKYLIPSNDIIEEVGSSLDHFFNFDFDRSNSDYMLYRNGTVVRSGETSSGYNYFRSNIKYGHYNYTFVVNDSQLKLEDTLWVDVVDHQDPVISISPASYEFDITHPSDLQIKIDDETNITYTISHQGQIEYTNTSDDVRKVIQMDYNLKQVDYIDIFATDQAGNKNSKRIIGWWSDQTPPKISGDFPDLIPFGNTGSVNFTITEKFIHDVLLYDGQDIISYQRNGTFVIPTNRLPPGKYNLTVVAIDVQGNVATHSFLFEVVTNHRSIEYYTINEYIQPVLMILMMTVLLTIPASRLIWR